jgi:hypothetical protein
LIHGPRSHLGRCLEIETGQGGGEIALVGEDVMAQILS